MRNFVERIIKKYGQFNHRVASFAAVIAAGTTAVAIVSGTLANFVKPLRLYMSSTTLILGRNRRRDRKKPETPKSRVDRLLSKSLLQDDTGEFSLPNPEIQFVEEIQTWVIRYPLDLDNRLPAVWGYRSRVENFFKMLSDADSEVFKFQIAAGEVTEEITGGNTILAFNSLRKKVASSSNTRKPTKETEAGSPDVENQVRRLFGSGPSDGKPSEVSKDPERVYAAITAGGLKPRGPLSRHL